MAERGSAVRGRHRVRAWLTGAAALAVAAAGSGPAAAATGTFRASFDGTFETTAVLLSFAGTGTGTELGAATVDGSSVVIPTLPAPSCPPPRITLRLVLDEVTVRAADGSRLVFRNRGTDCLDPQQGVIVADATYEVLGGTGRFTGARGSGTVTVTAFCSDELCTRGTFRDLRFAGSLT